MKQINYCTLIILQLLWFLSPQVLSLLKSKNKLQYCEKTQSRCMEMNHSILCLGVKLPYTSISTDLVLDADTLEEAQVSMHFCFCFVGYIIFTIIELLLLGEVAQLARTQKSSKMLGSYPTTFVCTIHASL
jgi:hypothetical protein